MSDQLFQAPSPEYLSELLPQYGVEFFIAQGGMGAVYKGRQLSLDRDIAIKVLPHEVGASEEFRESFISEAKSMARLNHSNLLGVFDYGTVEGMPYIVMEYVDGGSLHQAAYNQAVDPMLAATIAKGICDGLSHAHENGIVHRDIKPSNILLTQKLEPKIADFGLAHAADSDGPELVMGTPGYTAPEVFQDPSKAGPLADIYSIGVILHQLQTGVDPAGSMVPPSQPTRNLRLDAIWRKATNPDPAQRYATVAEMSMALEKWIALKQSSGLKVNSAPAPNPSYAVKQVKTGGSSAGKFFLVVALGAMFVAAYLALKEAPENIKTVDTDSETVPTEPPAPAPEPIPVVEPELAPEPEPTPVVEQQEPIKSVEPGDPELRARAVSLIEDAKKKHDEELAKNVSVLDSQLKSLSSGADADVVALIEALKKEIVESRIPSVDHVADLPDHVSKVFKTALTKEQTVIDAKHREQLTIIRDAYVTRLKAAAEKTSDGGVKERLLAQAGEAEDLDQWTSLLAP